MKKFKYFAFALVAALACGCLWSCSDDDDDNGSSENSLIGTWESVSIVQYRIEEGEHLYGSDKEKDCYDYLIEFKNNHRGYFESGYSRDFDFTWRNPDGKLVITIDDYASSLIEGTWTIKTLNASTLVLEQIDEEYYGNGYSDYCYTKITFTKSRYNYDSDDDDDDDSGSYDDDDWDW